MIDWEHLEIDRSKTLYKAIADKMEVEINRGALAPGERLPAQRKLAEWLSVDFTTVARAYAEAGSRGLIDRQVGRGSFVREHDLTISAAPGAIDPERQDATDSSKNMPPEPDDAELMARMEDGLSYVAANLRPLLRYQSPIGSDKDKRAASTWLSTHGLVPGLERIAITPGAHAAMTAILTMLTETGDQVLCERVTYPGIRSITRRLRLVLRGIEMDESGIRPDALKDAIREHKPRALYLNPTIQNPTTLTVPTERRLEIVEVLRYHGLPLIEDDAYGFLPPKPPAPLSCSAPELSYYIGGLAKCIGAGLRLAFVVTPTGKRTYQLGQIVHDFSVMPPPLSLGLATRWIEDGTADWIRRAIRKETAGRQAIAAEILEGFDYSTTEHAFSLWLRLPEGSTRAEVIGRMAGQRLGVVASDAFTVAGLPGEAVRVCLGGALDRSELRNGLHALSNAAHSQSFMG